MAMETKFDFSIPNLFVGLQGIVFIQNVSFSQCVTYKWFIDDICTVWKEDQWELTDFINTINYIQWELNCTHTLVQYNTELLKIIILHTEQKRTK